MRRAKNTDQIVPIQNLFSKYKNHLVAPQRSVEVVAEAEIKNLLQLPNLNGRLTSFQPQTRILHLKAPAVVKSEILKQKATLLKILKTKLNSKSVPLDIV